MTTFLETPHSRTNFFNLYDGATLGICVASLSSPGGVGVPWSRRRVSSRHDAVFAGPSRQEVTLHLLWAQNKEAQKWGRQKHFTHYRAPRVRDTRWSEGHGVKGAPPSEGGLHWQHVEPDQQDQHRWETARYPGMVAFVQSFDFDCKGYLGEHWRHPKMRFNVTSLCVPSHSLCSSLDLLRVELKMRKTCFWRHQKGKPDSYLATIEAIYYFLEDFHKHCLAQEYNGEYDNLLFFYSYLHSVVNKAKTSAEKCWQENLQRLMNCNPRVAFPTILLWCKILFYKNCELLYLYNQMSTLQILNLFFY